MLHKTRPGTDKGDSHWLWDESHLRHIRQTWKQSGRLQHSVSLQHCVGLYNWKHSCCINSPTLNMERSTNDESSLSSHWIYKENVKDWNGNKACRKYYARVNIVSHPGHVRLQCLSRRWLDLVVLNTSEQREFPGCPGLKWEYRSDFCIHMGSG